MSGHFSDFREGEEPARRARRLPACWSDAERKRYLETMKREAERHRRTLAALAK